MKFDITHGLIVGAILIVLLLIVRDWNASIYDDKSKADLEEPYVPNIDSDFAKYAPAYDLNLDYNLPSVGWLSRRGLLPWWNSTRDTKNMSYDIRGDIPPFRFPVGPWLNSPRYDYPYRYREIY